MAIIDWVILLVTLGFIVAYGTWKTRRESSNQGYLRGGDDARWWGVGLGVMATQASAVTFLSTPGQGYLDGVGFVQFYFGLPLAMLVIGAVFIPLYYRSGVYTAYEFIGKRFDDRTRLLTAGLFLLHRSLGAGITIYAPSIVLSKVLGLPLSLTCVAIGILVILYTTTGGARAVSVTQRQQMAVIFLGIFAALALTLRSLGDSFSVLESVRLADALGKLDAVDLSWDPGNKYTLWSGLIGGFFLQLSYFGTDQSQVQRYLGGQSPRQARLGLWMNGLLKIPMQFFILATGALVFLFYVVNPAPIHWNEANVDALRSSPAAATSAAELEARHGELDAERAAAAEGIVASWRQGDDAAASAAILRFDALESDQRALREEYRAEIARALPGAETNDKDYIFISFVMDHLPVGIIGLLLAMIFCAGMGSTGAELSALATTVVVDVLRRTDGGGDGVRATRWATLGFGLLAIGSTAVFSLFENLIQAINILGSLFYGTILGVFLVAFFTRRVGGPAVFTSALIAQTLILVLHFGEVDVAFLWYNLIAPVTVVLCAPAIQAVMDRR